VEIFSCLAVPETGRRKRLLFALLIVLFVCWWMLPPGKVSWLTSEGEVEPDGAESVAKVLAETAPAMPARGGLWIAAEPRIPQTATDASVGSVDQEQITIVIPAELLKSSLNQEDLTITIRRGDTLWEIADRYTGDPWNYRRIARENKIHNPDLIFPRQKINIRSEENP